MWSPSGTGQPRRAASTGQKTGQSRKTMHIEVKLFANLRKLLPPGSSGSKAQISLEEGATIEALIHHLKIPLEMAQMVLVNGEQTREFARPLAEGDTVSIFPPVAGG